MARYLAPPLSVLAPFLFLSLGSTLLLPQLGLCVATMAHSVGQENFAPSLSTPILTYENEVFISFHAEDTRTRFTSHLFAALEPILNGPEDKVNIWKATLKDVANLAGLHLKPYRPEPEFIEEIVGTIWKILYVESPTSTIPPWRQNDVPGQYSSLIIPQKSHSSPHFPKSSSDSLLSVSRSLLFADPSRHRSLPLHRRSVLFVVDLRSSLICSLGL
nr:hypothetical protein CFP56_68214 [Quercus suber]